MRRIREAFLICWCCVIGCGRVQALSEQGSGISPVALSQSSLVSSYSFSVLVNENIYLFWNIDNDIIEVAVLLHRPTGWLSLCIGAYDGGHIRSDMIVGMQGQVQDRYSYTQSQPHVDGEYNIISGSMNVTDTQSLMIFKRKLKSPDHFEDREIYTSMTTKVGWAWGDFSGNSMQQHPGDGFGKLWVNFKTGKAYSYSPGLITPLKFIVVLAFLVVCWVSFLSILVPIPLLYRFRREIYFFNYLKYSPFELFMIVLLIGANVLLFFLYRDHRIEVGITLAVPVEFCITLVFLSVLKSSFFNQLFGISYEKQVKYHRCVAWMAAIVIVAHSVVTFINFNSKGTAKKELKWSQNIFGLLALGVLTVIVVLALQFVRRRKWELFKVTHFLFLLFMVFGVLHSYAFLPPWTNFIYFCLPGFCIYVIDRIYRAVIKYGSKSQLVEVETKNNNLTILKINTKRKYHPGQYVEITFPEISRWQSHPYSISSSPSEESLTIHAKSLGKWSGKVVQTITPETKILLDGPYGIAPKWRKEQVLVLFSGGVGATPWISIIRDHVLSPVRPRPDNLYFYPSFSKASDLAWFSDTWELVNKEPTVHVKKYVSLKDKKEVEMQEYGSLKDETYARGRPSYQEILLAIVEANPNATRILVMACGPGSLWRSVQKECYKVSRMTKKNIYFSHELFKL